MRECPECGAAVILRSTVVDIRSMKVPPRQVEPFVKVTYWQCDRYRQHHGESHREPYDGGTHDGS